MLAAHRVMFFESLLYTTALVLAALVAGLFVGSALFTIAWRRTRGERVLGVRSHCPECGETLSLGEMIPVISWLRQHGICRHCDAPVSAIYPATELLGAGLFGSIVLRHGVTIETPELLVLASALMVATLSSLMDYRIPNACIVVAVLVRVAYFCGLAALGEDPRGLVVSSLVGAVALGLPLLVSVWASNALLARDVTGLGTVKLVTVVGLYLGWQQGLICMGIAAAIGTMVWVVSPAKRLPVSVEGGVRDGDAEPLPSPREMKPSFEDDIAEPIRFIPFAPSIVLAFWVMILIGVMPGAWTTPLL